MTLMNVVGWLPKDGSSTCAGGMVASVVQYDTQPFFTYKAAHGWCSHSCITRHK